MNSRVDLGALEVQGALRIVHIEKAPTGILLRVQGAPGETLQIQWSVTLAPESWNPLLSGTTDSAGSLQLTDTAADATGNRFYRVLKP